MSSVGGMPTVASDIDVAAIAKACGYANVTSAGTFDEQLAGLPSYSFLSLHNHVR